MRFLSVLSTLSALAVLLTACAQKPTPAATTAAEDTCGASPLQTYVGKTLDVELLKVIEFAVPKHRVRVLKPDTAATMDYVPERANVKTDQANVITAITCG